MEHSSTDYGEEADNVSMRDERLLTVGVCISVDLAGIMGGRIARAEGGLVPSGVGYGEGCPLFSRLGVWGSVVSSSSEVRGGSPAENGFWRFLKATARTLIVVLI